MEKRPVPLTFWEYDLSRFRGESQVPYLEPSLQEGTTPLVKRSGGKATRDFRNVHHPGNVVEADHRGARAIIDGHFKLVVHETKQGEVVQELFDLDADMGKRTNLIRELPEMAESLRLKLREWQGSVLRSLTGADYAR
jgi:hypothetical protein